MLPSPSAMSTVRTFFFGFCLNKFQNICTRGFTTLMKMGRKSAWSSRVLSAVSAAAANVCAASCCLASTCDFNFLLQQLLIAQPCLSQHLVYKSCLLFLNGFHRGVKLVVVEDLKLQDQNYCSSAYLLLNNHQLYAGPVGVVQYCITTPCTVKHV